MALGLQNTYTIDLCGIVVHGCFCLTSNVGKAHRAGNGKEEKLARLLSTLLEREMRHKVDPDLIVDSKSLEKSTPCLL